MAIERLFPVPILDLHRLLQRPPRPLRSAWLCRRNRRRPGGGGASVAGGSAGSGPSNMLRFYTDEAPGLKISPTQQHAKPDPTPDPNRTQPGYLREGITDMEWLADGYQRTLLGRIERDPQQHIWACARPEVL